MYCLSCCRYITRASLTDSTASSSSASHEINNSSELPLSKTKPTKVPRKSQVQQQTPLPVQKQGKSQQQKQLSVMQMERAIGAGTFRDAEPKDLDQEMVTYDGILPDFSGVFEGRVEKKIRETGEWLAKNTEEKLQSSRKGILLVVMTWILPIWTLSLLVASGAIKLPFSTPFLDDLIM